ncbi:MAG: LysR family transcriptional regulator [Lautropia sp.]
MRPTFAQLEAFWWIARLGSFHAASRHLHVTQPTITARIVELERVLGGRLFERDRQHTRLTARGRGLLDPVGRLLKLGDEIALSTRSARALRGTLRLGAVESVALLALPRLLPRFIANYPELKVELTLDVGAALNRKLNAGDLDLAVLTDPTGEMLTVEPVGLIELAWFASTQIRLPRRELRPADLRQLPILTMPGPSTIYLAMRAWFNAAGVEPERVSTCNSLALMVRLIAAGQGVAILPPAMVRQEPDSLRVRMLAIRPAMKPGVLAVAGGGPLQRWRPLIHTIVDVVRESGLVAPLPSATGAGVD